MRILGILLIMLISQYTQAQNEQYKLLPANYEALFSKNRLDFTQKPEPFPAFVAPIPKVYCYDDLAVFCKLEVQLEKKFKFPVKIRLGEVNYVDMLEGKSFSPGLLTKY